MINMNASLGTSLSVSKLGTGIYTVINDNSFFKIYSYVKIRGPNQSPGGYELNELESHYFRMFPHKFQLFWLIGFLR